MKFQRLLEHSFYPLRALRRSPLTPLRAFMLLGLVALAPDATQSAAPPAGTSIGNQASATYTDSSNTPRVASSIANLGKAWCSLQDAKREILGRPKAGVFKSESKRDKRLKPRSPIMPVLLPRQPAQSPDVPPGTP